MTEKNQQKDPQSESEKAESLYVGAKQQLMSLACGMQLIIPQAHVAQLFLGCGLGVLLTMGDDLARRWLQTALDSLDDDPAKVH